MIGVIEKEEPYQRLPLRGSSLFPCHFVIPEQSRSIPEKRGNVAAQDRAMPCSQILNRPVQQNFQSFRKACGLFRFLVLASLDELPASVTLQRAVVDKLFPWRTAEVDVIPDKANFRIRIKEGDRSLRMEGKLPKSKTRQVSSSPRERMTEKVWEKSSSS